MILYAVLYGGSLDAVTWGVSEDSILLKESVDLQSVCAEGESGTPREASLVSQVAT